MATVRLEMPFPPSVNTYWRHPNTGKLAGRHLISEKGRIYRKNVYLLLAPLKLKKLDGPLSVKILASMPDKRRRDLDNILKACLDSLTYAGVWEDDYQIDELSIKRMPKLGGFLTVEITQGDDVGSN